MPTRLIRFALVLGLVMIVFVGCASSEANDQSTAPETETEAAADPLVESDEPFVDVDYCAANQWLAACGPVLEDLSDAEFCAVLPDDIFCERFFEPESSDTDPDPEPRSTPVQTGTDDQQPTGGDSIGPIRVVPPPDEDAESISPVVIDPLLRRDDNMCLPSDRLAVEGDVDYDVAYQVVDGQLGHVCHGIPDDQVEAAWAILAELTPREHLSHLGIFAGFYDNRNNGRGAFVRPVGDRQTQEFLMAVNVVALDYAEYTIFTMAHEMSHVLTQRRGQMDRTTGPAECPTFHSGNGCHPERSLLNRWVEQFWSGDRPADIEERCEEDSGLLTAYAATSAHEDFADSFAAAVVGFRPENSGQDERFAFIAADPVLRSFVSRGQSLGYDVPRFLVGVCG